MKNFYQKGITIAEALIVIAIIGIILAVVLPQFSQMKRDQLLKNAGEDMVTSLSKAKSLTLASLDSSEYGVHFETNSFVFFKGTVYSAGSAGNDTINLRSPVSITTINLSGGASSVSFARLSGNPSAYGTITISNGSATRVINISATGIISIN